jgi:DNA-directed RNA polymerase specialized sigma24 family protein
MDTRRKQRLTSAQQETVLAYMWLAGVEAKRIKPPPGVDALDVHQEARLNLCIAAMRDNQLERSFVPFAARIIYQNTRDALPRLAGRFPSQKFTFAALIDLPNVLRSYWTIDEPDDRPVRSEDQERVRAAMKLLTRKQRAALKRWLATGYDGACDSREYNAHKILCHRAIAKLRQLLR